MPSLYAFLKDDWFEYGTVMSESNFLPRGDMATAPKRDDVIGVCMNRHLIYDEENDCVRPIDDGPDLQRVLDNR